MDRKEKISHIRTHLLSWFGRAARDLAWRRTRDPYRVWLSEIMLQQTTVAAVGPYFARFTDRWPTVASLANAEDADVMAEWAGLGYYARARNLLKCAREVVSGSGAQFPVSYDQLLALPGVGPYTASAIAAIAFDQPATVVDGNVERVISRVFAVRTPLPEAKKQLARLAESLTPSERPGDYAQAIMDLGATICTPRSPACGICPWMSACKARRLGIAAELPRKSPKKAKPIRQGIVYVAQRDDGAYLLEQRPDTGLLGGMQGWPCTEWTEDVPVEAPPLAADWSDPELEVRHTFTHFHLRLRIRLARVAANARPDRGRFVPRCTFRPTDLPSLMRKVHELALRDGPPIEQSDSRAL